MVAADRATVRNHRTACVDGDGVEAKLYQPKKKEAGCGRWRGPWRNAHGPRARPGQAAPPRGAAGAPPRPPCREGSWISRRRKRAGEVRCARRVRPLSPPRTRLATALAAKDGRETSILSTLRSRSTSRDSGPEADYPHPGSTASGPAAASGGAGSEPCLCGVGAPGQRDSRHALRAHASFFG